MKDKSKTKKTVKKLIIILLIIGVSIPVLIQGNKMLEYHSAKNLVKKQQYSEAYDIYTSLGDYKDSKKKAEHAFYNSLDTENNNKVKFGKYQDEDIDWIVISKSNKRMLLISEKIIDAKKVSSQNTDTHWANSELREWLNNDFYNSTFNEKEKNRIVARTLKATYKNEKIETTDNVFIISKSAVEKYFEDEQSRIAECTDFTVDNTNIKKKSTDDENVYRGSWWIRNIGKNDNCFKYVKADGSINENGHNVNDDSIGVRPAIWIDISE